MTQIARMNQPIDPGNILFSSAGFAAFELHADDLPALQALFETNADFFLLCNGIPPRQDEARREFEFCPPEGLSYKKQWMLGFADDAGELIAMAAVLSEFIATTVWHISLFIVAAPLHGTGVAKELYAKLEEWMAKNGAEWSRLGAVVGNQKAERFWEKLGYIEVRRAEEQTGNVLNITRIFVKPLRGGTVGDYLTLIKGDSPTPARQGDTR
jgi:GNAT superfamily N-acetyltransferase